MAAPTVQWKTKNFPFITVTIIFINILLFTARFWSGDYEEMTQHFSFIPNTLNAVGLVMYMFMHVDILHLFYNMVFLLLFGVVLEDRIGKLPFTAIFITSGIIGALIHKSIVDAFIPDLSGAPMIGASGAVSGVMGAFLCRCYFRKTNFVAMPWGMIPSVIRVRAWMLMFFFLVIDVVWGAKHSEGDFLMLAHWTHIGGFITGFGIALAVGYRKQGAIENYRAIGLSLMKEGTNLDDADKYFKRILETEPQDFNAMASLGELHSKIALTKKGNEYFRRAVLESYKSGNLELAVDIYIRYFPRYFGTFPLTTQLVFTRSLVNYGHQQLAAQTLEKWIEANPASPNWNSAAHELLNLYRKAGDLGMVEKLTGEIKNHGAQPKNQEKETAPSNP